MWRTRDALVAVFEAADPGFAFAVVLLALGVGVYGLTRTAPMQARYIHMVVGLVWTGCNVVIGLVVGPTLSAADDRVAADIYGRMAPRLAVLLPSLLVLVIGIGLPLAVQMGLFPHAAPWLALAGVVDLTAVAVVFGWRFDAWRDRRWQGSVAVFAIGGLGLFGVVADGFAMTLESMFLTLLVGSAILVVGLGVILSGNVRATLETRRADPDHGLIAAVGRQNAMLARLQILLQIVIIISVL